MKINLLLVDDERDFVEILSERLAARGFAVRSSLNGEEALAAIRDGDVDVRSRRPDAGMTESRSCTK